MVHLVTRNKQKRSSAPNLQILKHFLSTLGIVGYGRMTRIELVSSQHKGLMITELEFTGKLRLLLFIIRHAF